MVLKGRSVFLAWHLQNDRSFPGSMLWLPLAPPRISLLSNWADLVRCLKAFRAGITSSHCHIPKVTLEMTTSTMCTLAHLLHAYGICDMRAGAAAWLGAWMWVLRVLRGGEVRKVLAHAEAWARHRGPGLLRPLGLIAEASDMGSSDSSGGKNERRKR